MGDDFQILNLTENPFPQNPVIIIDGNDKRTNGLIHYAKIFENENEKFKKFNVSDKISIIKGKFEDTLFQKLSDQKFSFVLFDADLYNSTKFALDFVFPRLVNGGIMVFQDYEREEKLEYSWGERQAVDEFFSLHNLKLNNDKSLMYFQLKNNENVNKNL